MESDIGATEKGRACANPALRPPIPVPLVTTREHQCGYLADRMATVRAFCIDELPGRIYHEFMNASFRRSGKMICQPVCRGCRQCMPMRLAVERFKPDKSQRRSWKRNGDLAVEVGEPVATDEKYALYRRYHGARHGEKEMAEESGRENFEAFLYASPVETIEFCYRDEAGALMAVGICDVCSASLSSVYFYFDPEQARRGLGTYGILREIEFAREHGIPYYYLGYWVAGSRKMDYKARFRPHEILQPDGRWVDSSSVTRQDALIGGKLPMVE